MTIIHFVNTKTFFFLHTLFLFYVINSINDFYLIAIGTIVFTIYFFPIRVVANINFFVAE